MSPPLQFGFFPVNPRLTAALSMKYVRTLITLVLYLARLASSIRRADVLHIFTPGYFAFYLAPVPALLLARMLGKPAILNYHDGRAGDHLAHWPMARRLMRLATTIVVPSDYLVEVFARFGLRATRIHNVAETEWLPYRHRDLPRPVFLHNRGLSAEYNPACTLLAFAIIQQRYPTARLTVAHDGPLRPQLETLARTLGLRQTQFVGSVSRGTNGGVVSLRRHLSNEPQCRQHAALAARMFRRRAARGCEPCGRYSRYGPGSNERPAFRT